MGSIGGIISPGGSIALGIIVGLLSTGVQSLGLTLQRQSHMLEDEKGPHDVRRPPHRRRRWQLGMAMFVVSNLLGSTVQISTLPLPVLSTLQASGLVFNSICATLILGEPFTRWSLWGTLLVCAGAVPIAVFGAIPAPAHNLDELLELLVRRMFVVWMVLTGLVVVVVAVAIDSVNHLSTVSQSSWFRLLRGLSYGCISGILSAHLLLVAKSAVELIIKTIVDGNNQFGHWQSWVLLLVLVALALTQLYYLHRGLKLVSTSVLYPLVFCIYNIIAILNGLIYFRQTDLISPLRACLIALGTAILLSGVLALSWRLSDDQHSPGVGQSTLAPGLGLVEDTEGEEESLAESDTLLDEVEAPFVSYQTFSPQEGAGGPGLLPGPNGGRVRMREQAEIWGELDDRQELGSTANQRRSVSFPSFGENTALLPERRDVSGGSVPAPASSAAGVGSDARGRRSIRKRRRSTGFPGFTARKSSRRRGQTLQGTMGGFWKSKIWARLASKRSTASTSDDTPSRGDGSDEGRPTRGGDETGIGRGANDSAV